jgi:hypothetical protein
MKTRTTLLIILAIIVNSAFTKSNNQKEKTSFSVSETEDYYEADFLYYEERESFVHKVLNDFTKPATLFVDRETKVKKTITTMDGISLLIKSSPRELNIHFSKRDHSKSDFARVKNLIIQLQVAAFKE